VNEERLWAPWRLAYVTGGETGPQRPPEPTAWLPHADRECFLCQAAAEYESPLAADREMLVAERGATALVVLNRYPYNNGHLLVAPKRHVGQLHDLSRGENLECVERLAQLTCVYRERLSAEGFNIGLNLGKFAGAGLPGHLHWHLVPRWAGDNNFMPVLAGTRVIPQSLETLWELLVEALRPSKGKKC
jgi:ATP adenylyltransferase